MRRGRIAFYSFCVAAVFIVPIPAFARELVVAMGIALPPYVFADERKGIDYDIIAQSLALEGIALSPRFGPFGRIGQALEAGVADAVATQMPDTGVDAHFSDPYITYQNFAISLASRNLSIERVADLKDKSILAFQRASVILGPEFRAMAEANPAYHEEPKQVSQPILLFLERVDVVISDRAIFDWFARQPDVAAKTDTSQPVRYHPVFAPTQFRVAFRDSSMRDSFNRGLAKLRASGGYERIQARYRGPGVDGTF